MASLGPWLGGGGGRGRRGGWELDPWFGSPFFSDILDLTNIGSNGRDDTTDMSDIAHAHVDWCETSNARIFRADLPEVRKEDVKVHVETETYCRSAERGPKKEDKNDTWHRVERRCGSFSRRFRPPENANMTISSVHWRMVS